MKDIAYGTPINGACEGDQPLTELGTPARVSDYTRGEGDKVEHITCAVTDTVSHTFRHMTFGIPSTQPSRSLRAPKPYW